jgi:septal ring factor EnvC (AmiA/AmiB activator)
MQEVKRLISEIESKVVSLKTQLGAKQLENDRLQEQVSALIFKLNQREEELKDFEQKLQSLEQQAPLTRETDNQNEMIDALVREIDDCISRLKQ